MWRDRRGGLGRRLKICLGICLGQKCRWCCGWDRQELYDGAVKPYFAKEASGKLDP